MSDELYIALLAVYEESISEVSFIAGARRLGDYDPDILAVVWKAFDTVYDQKRVESI